MAVPFYPKFPPQYGDNPRVTEEYERMLESYRLQGIMQGGLGNGGGLGQFIEQGRYQPFPLPLPQSRHKLVHISLPSGDTIQLTLRGPSWTKITYGPSGHIIDSVTFYSVGGPEEAERDFDEECDQIYMTLLPDD